MQARLEQRANIKLCMKLGQNQAETVRTLQKAYGQAAPSVSTIRHWYLRIQNDENDLQSRPIPRRPRSSRTAEAVDKVRECLEKDTRQTVREIAFECGLSKDCVHRILVQELSLKRIASRFVLHVLTDEHRQIRCDLSMENLIKTREDPTLLDRLITTDECWVSIYKPETKQQSMYWLRSDQPRPVKATRGRSLAKTMLILFFDSRGPLHIDFLPEGETVNSEYFISVLREVRESIRRKQPDLWNNRKFVLHMDNASSHTSGPTRLYLHKNNFDILDHLLYSPDLAPCDYWAFPVLKKQIRGQRFAGIPELQARVTLLLKQTPQLSTATPCNISHTDGTDVSTHKDITLRDKANVASLKIQFDTSTNNGLEHWIHRHSVTTYLFEV